MTAYRVRYTPEAAGRIRKLHPEVKQKSGMPFELSSIHPSQVTHFSRN